MKKSKLPQKRIAVIEKRHYYADVIINNVKYTKFMVHFVDDDDYYYMYKPKTHKPSSVPRSGQTVSFTVYGETARNVRVIK